MAIAISSSHSAPAVIFCRGGRAERRQPGRQAGGRGGHAAVRTHNFLSAAACQGFQTGSQPTLLPPCISLLARTCAW